MTPSVPSEPAPGRRYASVDALRGFDLFWILGADAVFSALYELSKNFHSPALAGPVAFLARQFEHCEWAGFHFYDLIFPLFVFIMGVSTVFSLTRIIETEGRSAAVRRVLWRGLLLFLCGLIYTGGLSKPWPDVRLMGVLNRTALCYTFGGLLFIWFRPRTLVAVTVGLLLGYWALMALVPFPDVRPIPGGDMVISRETGFTKVSQLNLASTNCLRGVYLPGVNLANYLDQKYLPGFKYDGTYDPEGYLSNLPALATGLLGIFAGLLIREPKLSDRKKVLWLLGAGVAGVALGWAWDPAFPVIKKIWTSSYVLVAGGYSALLLGVFYWLVEVRQWQRWCRPFIWIGMNPITLYMTASFLGGGGFEKLAVRFAGGSVKDALDHHLAPGCGQLFLALVTIVLFTLVARFLYQRKIFLRI